MEKKMVQCQDGRRRQARIHGMPEEEGDFKIWKAGIRLKGKHVNGDAWYSYKTKTWYFLTDPDGKHAHLMDRIHSQMRNESIRQFQDQLKVLQSRYSIEQRKIAEHRTAMKTIEAEMEQIMGYINKTKAGIPIEADKPLEYSRLIKR